MQIETKTSYTISLSHEEMIRLALIIKLATAYCRLDITKEMEELAMDILEQVRE
jgi:hypothetical protein